MYNLARGNIANNNCVSASILLLSKLNPQRSQSGIKEKNMPCDCGCSTCAKYTVYQVAQKYSMKI